VARPNAGSSGNSLRESVGESSRHTSVRVGGSRDRPFVSEFSIQRGDSVSLRRTCFRTRRSRWWPDGCAKSGLHHHRISWSYGAEVPEIGGLQFITAGGPGANQMMGVADGTKACALMNRQGGLIRMIFGGERYDFRMGKYRLLEHPKCVGAFALVCGKVWRRASRRFPRRPGMSFATSSVCRGIPSNISTGARTKSNSSW